MPEVAMGVKVFSRTEKLQQLLDSVSNTVVDTVYVADDGEPSSEKSRIYDAEYPFELELLDLAYDAGLGYGRNRILEASDAEYLLIVDSDHELPSNLSVLVDQLEARPDIGGVSGLLFERGKIRGTCHDLYENGDVLVRDVREDKSVERVAGHPFVSFDFIPNAVLFRRECLEDASWDPEYVIGKEHLDFYVTHREQTEWVFGVNPTVLFDHHPGGDAGYVADRENAAKLERSKQYFLDKWGYTQLVLGQTDWYDATTRLRDPSRLGEAVAKSVLLSLPPGVQAPLMDFRDLIRKRRARPPL